MNKLDIISSQLNFISLLNAVGYSVSDVVFKRHGASTDFNAGFWTFVAEQKDRYIEVSCSLSHPTAEGTQHIDVRIDMFEDPIDDEISRTLDTNTGNDSNLLIVFYVQIMPDDFVMQLHRF
ncbi:hypothetical protein [Enterobacter hormaechei]|uniref:hypothetical protein n=1 Tax=Enterobacter hormaechei TaxID=158836 RepID=UPI001653DC99|nr:hypothetical protein [Enterobacter hormaechei]